MNILKKMNILTKTIIVLLVLVVVFLLSFKAIFKAYEDGVLEISASSQDGYVELVVNQIRLKENRSDEKIISSIIQTLDSSSNKYWTFSKGANILFVKNVLETNRYKGISASSYYTSRSARTFITSLSQNVSHALITVEDKQYMASGAVFNYDGQKYRLVLLTTPDVLLDNNTYLSAKMAMVTMIGLLIILFAVAPMTIAWYYLRLQKESQSQKIELQKLNHALAVSNERINEELIYHKKENVWNISILPSFLENLKKREISCLTVTCHFTSAEKQDFIKNGYKLINKKYLLFEEGNDLTLLFVHFTKDEAKRLFEAIDIKMTSVEEYAYGREKI